MNNGAKDSFNDQVLRELVSSDHLRLLGQSIYVPLTIEQIALIRWALETFESAPVLQSLSEAGLEGSRNLTPGNVERILRCGFALQEESRPSVAQLRSDLDGAIEKALSGGSSSA